MLREKVLLPLHVFDGLPREVHVIFFARIMNNIGSFVQPLLVLILTQKIGMASDRAGFIVTMQTLACAPGIIIAGKLADTIGRKPIILFSQGMGAAAVMLCGLFAPSIITAYLLIVSSFFYSMSMPAFDALVADITTPANRRAAFSLTYMGLNIGFAVGPVLGGLLFEHALALLFIGDSVTTCLATLLIMCFVSETSHRTRTETDANLPMERRVDESVFRLLLHRPILLRFAAISFLYYFVFSQWDFSLPLQTAALFGQRGAVVYGLLAGFNGLTVIGMTPLLTKCLARMQPIDLIALGGLCYGISFILFGFLHPLPLLYVGVFIMTIGEILVSVNSRTFIADYSPASHRGRISSVLPIITGAGYTISPVVTGRIIAASSLPVAWAVASCIGVTSAILMWKLRKHALRERHRPC
ncbi:MAG: MFS transporter [Sporolactobacillus sp.]|jgi:MFS family permease|nr:MFS transporter [Sporolactobacillus sp.]